MIIESNMTLLLYIRNCKEPDIVVIFYEVLEFDALFISSFFTITIHIKWYKLKLSVYKSFWDYYWYPPVSRFVGKLVGCYYDSQGNATKYLKGAEAKAARGSQLLEKQKIEEAKQPNCNSRWSQDDGGEVRIHAF